MKAYPKPDKVFPRIGLKNCKVKLSSATIDKQIAYETYANDIMNAFAYIGIYDISRDKSCYNDMYLLKHLTSHEYTYDDAKCEVIEKKDQTIIQMSAGHKFTHFKLNKDRDLIDLFEQVKNADIPKTELTKLNKVNLNLKPDLGKNLSICFTSDGNKGYWDLATMSMRGVSSCMAWSSGHAPSLIGTILDPYAGMIYITDGKSTKHGEKIIARSVVRLAVNQYPRNKQKPIILLEPIYTAAKDIANRSAYNTIFRSFISSMIKNKVDVKCLDKEVGYDDGYSQYAIPVSEPVNVIIEMEDRYNIDDDSILSYRDSCINYETINKFYDPKKVKL